MVVGCQQVWTLRVKETRGNILGNVGLPWPLKEGRNQGEVAGPAEARLSKVGQAVSLPACHVDQGSVNTSLTWKDSMQET